MCDWTAPGGEIHDIEINDDEGENENGPKDGPHPLVYIVPAVSFVAYICYHYVL